MATRLYGLFWKWHFAVGLIACPLVAIVALTGAIYAFEPELKRWADSDALVVEPTGSLRSLDELAAVATTRCQVTGVQLPGRPDGSYAFYCEDERTVFIDPYRAEVLPGISSTTAKVVTVAFDLHWELMLGERGRLLVEWATSCTVLLMITGAILWWPRGKRRSGGVWYPRTKLKERQLLRDLHAVAGGYALPVVLALSATGLMWTVHAGDDRWSKVVGHAEHEHEKSKPAGDRIGLDAAIAAAKVDPVAHAMWIGIPHEPDGNYDFYVHMGDQSTPSVIQTVSIEAYTGRELERESWDKRTAMQKVDIARYSIHVGAILGLPGRVAAFVASIILGALCITGPWMWWKRRPKGQLGIPPAARAPKWIYPVVALLGWLLPTVGATLLLLVAIELVRWGVNRMRETTPVT
jgi:uncharacterized iron-regulated membrane protein